MSTAHQSSSNNYPDDSNLLKKSKEVEENRLDFEEISKNVVRQVKSRNSSMIKLYHIHYRLIISFVHFSIQLIILYSYSKIEGRSNETAKQ